MTTPTPLPPAQPTYTLRGHTAQLHSLHFYSPPSLPSSPPSSSRVLLFSGDADGWVVVWDLVTRRAVLVWRPHRGGVLGVGVWARRDEGSGSGEREDADEGSGRGIGDGWGLRVVTHGRDNTLKVWELPASVTTSTTASNTDLDNQGFSTTLPTEDDTTEPKTPWLLHSLTVNALNFCSFAMISPPPLPFAPNTDMDDSKTTASNNTPRPDSLLIIATPGLEDGQIALTTLPDEKRLSTILPPASAKPKTGMLMAVALHYPSSSNSNPSPTTLTPQTLPTVVAGYESGHVAVFAAKPTTTSRTSNPKELWQLLYLAQPHSQPVLSLSLAPSKNVWFSSSADAIIARHPLHPQTPHDPNPNTNTTTTTTTPTPPTDPSAILKTKHAGQQSLTTRSDAKIFATAGWDGRVRVYKTAAAGREMRELACLRWHGTGVYAVAFAEVVDAEASAGEGVAGSGQVGGRVRDSVGENTEFTVAELRVRKTRGARWLAAGGKDGKVSLWEVY
ncbi:hypothetical protein MBLNU230_g2969t1 [Neophaeotheca triangularis]